MVAAAVADFAVAAVASILEAAEVDSGVVVVAVSAAAEAANLASAAA
jgi:hypothetical protein